MHILLYELERMDSKENFDKRILQNYEIGKMLGKGAYGIAWKAVDKETKKTVVLKKKIDAFRNVIDARRYLKSSF